MSNSPEDSTRSLMLRQRAEDLLRGKPVDLADLPIEDIQKMVHELQVYQIELTLQNEDLRKTQLELETARDQFSDLYNFAPVGYCTLNRKDQVVVANKTLAELLDIDPQKLHNQKLSHFIARKYQDSYYLHHQQVVENRQHLVVEIQMVKHQGKPFDARLESVVDHEDPTRLRVVINDITERKQVEKALEQYSHDLERANQAMHDFTFIVSHDLQEPLRKVKSFGELLKSNFGSTLGPQGNDYIARMMAAAARMDSMLRGLLAISRVTTKAEPFGAVDLQEIASEALSDLEGRLMQTSGTVMIDELPVIQADPLQMRQLFQNLISNALKYHREGFPPRVRVTGQLVEDQKVQITVNDNGIGLDMKFQDYIFEPFTRLSNISESDGNGMGLAICKKIVERHNGTISVSSVLGEGTTFTVILPR